MVGSRASSCDGVADLRISAGCDTGMCAVAGAEDSAHLHITKASVDRLRDVQHFIDAPSLVCAVAHRNREGSNADVMGKAEPFQDRRGSLFQQTR